MKWGDGKNRPFVPFSRVLGQEKAVVFLKRALEREQIPHAYLFAGIPGVGKTAVAVAFARAVNCLEPGKGEDCRCRSCRQIMSGNFPDLTLLEPEGYSIKIGQIRDLNHSLAFRPVSGRHRVSIVKKAELMTEQAANAFLKTLEEPPLGNILILTVTEPLDLLPTIASRCQKVPFRPLTVDAIEQGLMDQTDMERDKARLLAKISEGSLGKALKKVEDGFLEKREEHLLRLFALPHAAPEECLETAAACVKTFKNKGSGSEEKGEGGLFDLIEVWGTWYRDLLLCRTGASERLLINRDLCHKLRDFQKHFTEEGLLNSLALLDRAGRDLLKARNQDLTMENTLLGLRRFVSSTAVFGQEAGGAHV